MRLFDSVPLLSLVPGPFQIPLVLGSYRILCLLFRTTCTDSLRIGNSQNISAIRAGVEGLNIGMNTGLHNLARTLTADFSTTLKQYFDRAPQHSKTDSSQTGKSKKLNASNDKGDASAKKQKALSVVKRHFPDGDTVSRKIKIQRQDIADSFIPGTTALIFEDEQFMSWLAGDLRLAWMSGAAGIGKTYLTHSIVLELEERRKEHTDMSVAYFYFREEDETLRSFRNALLCTAIQIAEQDSGYCEQIAADIIRDDSINDPWKQFFSSAYPSSSESHLYLVFDGIDEACDEDKPVILSLFNQIAQDELNIHVLFTSRAELTTHTPHSTLASIAISKEGTTQAMRRLIEARCKPRSQLSLSRLSKFRQRARTIIRDKILQSADGMLYVEHMLRRLNTIGRESAVLKDIEKNTPDSMTALYDLMLLECRRGRTEDEYLVLRTLFAMLAYSKRPLTLDEAGHLVRLIDSENTFDVEIEIMGRSARILHSRQVQDEEEEDVEFQGIKYSDQAEESGLSDDTAGQSPIMFQDRLLREYFRAISIEDSGLRTPASMAHLMIFELLVKVLCVEDASETREQDQRHLRHYAANYWAFHFASIKEDQITSEQTARVLAGLAKIFANKNNVCKTFEEYSSISYSELQGQTGFVDKIHKYIDHAMSSDSSPIHDDDSRCWLETLSGQPTRAWLSIARGHVENWQAAIHCWPAFTSWSHADQALKLVRSYHVQYTDFLELKQTQAESGATGEVPERVLIIAKQFTDMESSADGLRCIGLALHHEGHSDRAIDYYARSIRESSESTRNAFYSHWHISLIKSQLAGTLWQFRLDNIGPTHDDQETTVKETDKDVDVTPQCQSQEVVVSPEVNTSNGKASAPEMGQAWTDASLDAMHHIEKALETLPTEWNQDMSLLEDPLAVHTLLILRAECEKFLGRPGNAIDTYHKAKMLQPLAGTELDDMTRVRDWGNNPRGFIELTQSWSSEDIIAWFEYLFQTPDRISTENLHRYTKLSGPDNFDYVIQCYENYLKTLPRNSAKRVYPQCTLAVFYWQVIGNIRKAVEWCTNTLDMDIRNNDVIGLEESLLDTRLRKSEMLFLQFRNCIDPGEKGKMLEEMEKLASDRIAQQAEADFSKSQSALMFAIMLRTCGRIADFQSVLNKSFRACVEGLSDSIGWNDSGAARRLAKVLACLPGMERDAQIAISCQFSITDPSVEHGDNTSVSSGDTQDEVSEGKSDERALESPKTQVFHKNDQSVVNESSPDTGADHGSITNVEATLTAGPSQSNIRSNQSVQEQPNLGELHHRPSEDQLSTIGQDQQDSVKDEDLLPESESRVFCNGDCDTSVSSWSQPLYFCIHCADTDLCETCYQKRKAIDQGEPCSFWRLWCGEQHRHIKG